MKFLIKNMCQVCQTVKYVMQVGNGWCCLSCLKYKVSQFEKLINKNTDMPV